MKYEWVDRFLMEKRGVTKDFKQEWQWTRYMIGGKMFAAVCKNEAGEDRLITLKLEPSEGDFLRQQYPDIIPGYYMNKTHWNSIKTDGEVPDDLLKDMLDKSYQLVFHGLSKKMQAEIEAGEKEKKQSVEEYIAGYNGDVRLRMEKLREIILSCSPDITEKISWGMATFVLNGNLVHFSGEKRHMGFHPAPSAILAFADQFGDYKYSKGTLQLPYDKPMPYDLLREMTMFRVKEQMEKAKKK